LSSAVIAASQSARRRFAGFPGPIATFGALYISRIFATSYAFIVMIRRVLIACARRSLKDSDKV